MRLVSRLMKDCCNCDRLGLSEAVFAKYVREAMTEGHNSSHHIIVWNTLIKIYVKRGMLEKATKGISFGFIFLNFDSIDSIDELACLIS